MDGLDFAIGTRVRLAERFGILAAGSEGVVIGYYRTDPPAYAVAIAEKSLQVPPEYLVASDADARDVT